MVLSINKHDKLSLSLTVLLMICSQTIPPALADDGSGDLNFSGSQKWSIVPAGSSTSTSTKSSISTPARNNTSSIHSLPGSDQKSMNWVQSPKTADPATVPAAAAPAAPIKLYGRIEELCTSTGAKIPLKLQAMTPIRDSSLDAPKVSKLSGKVDFKAGKIAGIMPGKTDSGNTLKTGIDKTDSKLSGEVSVEQPSFPTDFRGTWTGMLTVNLVDFDQSYYDFDRAEAEKQASLIKPGIQGKCSVSFYQGSNDKIQVKPTQVVFTIMRNLADEARDLGNSPLGALLGGANNPMLANVNMPIPFAIPLGTLSGNTGVTGNQLTSELAKLDLKELARGVMEEQIVTHDSDRNASGQTRNYYTESVMRFTRMSNDKLYMQAASVSYDNDGNYLDKIVMSGTLSRGGSNDVSPETFTLFGNPNQSGSSGGLGSDLFGGNNAGGGGNGGGGMMEQVQQLLQQLGGGQ